MVGRTKNKAYSELNFDLVKINGRHAAFCNVCKKNLLNTAEVRLRQHRNVCKMIIEPKDANASNNNPENESEVSVIYIVEDNSNNEVQLLDAAETFDISMENSSNVLENDRSPVSSNFKNKQAISCSSTSLNSNNEFVSRPASAASFYFNNNKQNLNSNVNHFSSGSLSTTSSVTALSSNDDQSFFASSKNRKRPVSKKNSSSITAFADRLSEKEEAEIHQSLAEVFYGCNIPLSVVESIYFKNLIKKLRPAYADKIPGRKALSTSLLDTSYEKCLASAKETMGSEAVLLIDGWKNSASNCKTVVSMLHNANGEQGFLEAWDLTCESETAEKLAEIVSESVKLAETIYSTHVYAVVSDNASAMKKMGQLMSHLVWKSNCSSHTGNLLAKDIANKELNLKVTSVLKEFKHADLEKLIVEKGGTRMKLPCDTRWCSYRDAYKCLLLNSQIMRQVAADSKVSAKSVGLLFDEEFMTEIKKYVQILDPICKLINECQSQKCSAADAVDTWLSLELPAEYSTKLKNRQNMALNKYSLSAFYLHPFKDKAKLNNEHDGIIFEFLFQNLDGTGIEEWDHYRNKTGFFKTLFEKDIQKPCFLEHGGNEISNISKVRKKIIADSGIFCSTRATVFKLGSCSLFQKKPSNISAVKKTTTCLLFPENQRCF